MRNRRPRAGVWIPVALCAAVAATAGALMLPTGPAMAAQGAQDGGAGAKSQRMLARDLKWLESAKGTLSAETQEALPALRAIVRRYWLEPASLRAIEQEIGEEIDREAESAEQRPDIVARGGSRLDDLLRDGGALPPKSSSHPSHPAHPTGHASGGSHAAPHANGGGDHAVARMRAPRFKAVEYGLPGGKRRGAVELTAGASAARIVEIPAPSGGLTVRRRAEVIASDLAALSRREPLWWTHLAIGTAHNECVVLAPRAPRGYIITADADSAREWHGDRRALARWLIEHIHDNMDRAAPNGIVIRGGEKTPEQVRGEAVQLRQQADAIYDRDPAAAEKLYQQSRATDPDYTLAYLRLADLYAGQGRADKARAVLEAAQASKALEPDYARDIRARLSALASRTGR